MWKGDPLSFPGLRLEKLARTCRGVIWGDRGRVPVTVQRDTETRYENHRDQSHTLELQGLDALQGPL